MCNSQTHLEFGVTLSLNDYTTALQIDANARMLEDKLNFNKFVCYSDISEAYNCFLLYEFSTLLSLQTYGYIM